MRRQRWYDQKKYQNVKNSIDFMLQLPEEGQNALGKVFLEVAKKEFPQSDFKNIGVEGIIALHKSKNKARPYDNNYYLHNGMNYFKIIPEENRPVLAKHMYTMCSYTADYLRFCKEFDLEPDFYHMEYVARSYLSGKGEECEKALQQIRRFVCGYTPGERVILHDERKITRSPESQKS